MQSTGLVSNSGIPGESPRFLMVQIFTLTRYTSASLRHSEDWNESILIVNDMNLYHGTEAMRELYDGKIILLAHKNMYCTTD
jgi:hypothetical protein